MFKTLKAATLAALTTFGVTMPSVAEEKRELGYSFNVALTSDYIFRGFTQTSRAATGQAGFDLTWGKFYAGVWGSGLDFGYDTGNGKNTAHAEVDFVAGFKPEWAGINFDFGMIYYVYPGARDKRTTTLFDREADYFELKAGASREVWKDGTLSGTLFWSPEYTNATGRVWTGELGIAQVLPKVAGLTPTLSALVGYQTGNELRFNQLVGNGRNNYTYWNAGVTFGWEKFTFDMRYWDTNIKDNALANNFCSNRVFECSGRYMGTLKFTY